MGSRQRIRKAGTRRLVLLTVQSFGWRAEGRTVCRHVRHHRHRFDRDERLGSILTEAGKRLPYRGYDSVVLASIPALGDIDLRKDVGKVNETT